MHKTFTLYYQPRTLSRGMTLIEVTIFTVLLSLLIVHTINYLYTINISNIRLMNEAQDAQKGFIATTAIILLSMGTLVFLLATLGAVTSYADTAGRREARIQKHLNQRSCDETLPILVAKDYFMDGDVNLGDFGCVVHK